MTITRLVLAGGGRGMRCLLAGAALLLAFTGTTAGAASASTALGPPPPAFVKPCVGKKAVGPFTTRGSQVYGKGNAPFISYGATVAFSLDAKTWPSGATAKGDMDEKEIKWAATDWCANTVRIQVNQDLLDPTGSLLGVNTSYLDAIEAEVTYAKSFGLVVVLNDSTESSANSGNEKGPTQTTFAFWLWMAGIYGSDPAHVIFDPFNEPRDTNSQMSPQAWNTWFNGNGTYYGMNLLAKWVHFIAPRNLLWIEGPNLSDSFAGMYPKYLIRLPNVVYAIHHPLGGMDGQEAWNAAFGDLIGKGIPVVEGEWTNFAGAGSGNSACWPDAIKEVPIYLNTYLTANHIGLSAYTLNSGRLLRQLYVSKNGKLVQTAPNPLEPTVFPQGKTTIGWSCSPDAYKSPGAMGTEGAGEAVYDFFKARNQA